LHLLALLSVCILLGSCSGSSDKKDGNNQKDSIVSLPDKANKPAYARYDLKSGIITFKASVVFMDQEMILYFDDWGLKQRTEINVSVMGKEAKNVTITDTSFVYLYDPDKKTGTRTPIDPKSPDNINFTALNDDVIKTFSITKEGEEKVLDRLCTVYSMDYKKADINGKFYIWNGIALKTETSAKGISIKMEATKIEENVSIPAEKFIIPKDIQFKTVNSTADSPNGIKI